MKALLVLLTLAAAAVAQDFHYQSGYTRKDGTYVPGHYQTNPNGSRTDNWSTKGNYNPITGQAGTKSPSTPAPRYPYGR